MKTLSSEEFFRRIFIHFIEVNVSGQVSIMPRSLTVIQPFERKFCGEKSLIFVNHLYFSKFRIAICPKDTADTIYLDVDFKNKEIYTFYRLVEI